MCSEVYKSLIEWFKNLDSQALPTWLMVLLAFATFVYNAIRNSRQKSRDSQILESHNESLKAIAEAAKLEAKKEATEQEIKDNE